VSRLAFVSGGLVGLGSAAFVDEVVFHQILHWHHFYDRSTSAVGLVSDGLFHAVSWLATVGGLLLLARLRASGAVRARAWWAGWFVWCGVFQLYDGVVQHKLLGLHQIRYGVDLTPYDTAWLVVAVALIGVGAVLGLRSRERAA
jgi:uncharacterized membrane protein